MVVGVTMPAENLIPNRQRAVESLPDLKTLPPNVSIGWPGVSGTLAPTNWSKSHSPAGMNGSRSTMPRSRALSVHGPPVIVSYGYAQVTCAMSPVLLNPASNAPCTQSDPNPGQ